MHINAIAEIEKEGVDIPVLGHLVAGECTIRWLHLVFNLFSLYTLFSCIRQTVQSCEYFGMLGRNSS